MLDVLGPLSLKFHEIARLVSATRISNFKQLSSVRTKDTHSEPLKLAAASLPLSREQKSRRRMPIIQSIFLPPVPGLPHPLPHPLPHNLCLQLAEGARQATAIHKDVANCKLSRTTTPKSWTSLKYLYKTDLIGTDLTEAWKPGSLEGRHRVYLHNRQKPQFLMG
jgi:hypothetical protein